MAPSTIITIRNDNSDKGTETVMIVTLYNLTWIRNDNSDKGTETDIKASDIACDAPIRNDNSDKGTET